MRARHPDRAVAEPALVVRPLPGSLQIDSRLPVSVRGTRDRILGPIQAGLLGRRWRYLFEPMVGGVAVLGFLGFLDDGHGGRLSDFRCD
jgi:hypothetical protein